MHILIAPDKFKGSLTARAVVDALRRGIHSANPSVTINGLPLADGGDGSLSVVAQYVKGEWIECTVRDPLDRPVTAAYYLVGAVAYIELATASGLALLAPTERDALQSSTHGTGQLIADALKRGVRKVVLFVGGSATTAVGLGIAEALGFRFYNDKNQLLRACGATLSKIVNIDASRVSMNLNSVDIIVLTDVNNPLYGPRGAAHVYAAQKGANPPQVHQLDDGLRAFHTQLLQHGYPNVANLPGAGAAGGVGAGLVALLGATLHSGLSFFMKLTQVDSAVRAADLVITGEGKIDDQTAHGKVVSGVAEICAHYCKPLILVGGQIRQATAAVYRAQATYGILSIAKTEDDAMKRATEYLEHIGQQIGNTTKQQT